MKPVRQIGPVAFATGVTDLHVEDGESLSRDGASGKEDGKHGRDQNRRRSAMRSLNVFVAGIAGLFMTVVAFGATAQPQQDPDWPCIQRLVPALSAGQIWSGPPIDEVGAQWPDDPEIASLVSAVTSRRVSIDEAVDRTEAFANDLDAGQAERLTILFAGIFQRIDESRATSIAAIKRYSRAQRGMVDAMSAELTELEELRQEPSKNAERIEELAGNIEINRRIFADRHRALRPLCEQPVLMEERLGALARAIMGHLG